jgi:site-specific DNA recombinase
VRERAAALYARVSTEEQAEHGTSLEAQLAECERRARELGATTCLAYVDAGQSGTDLDRPALQRLREDVAGGRVDLVVCLDPDRLSRNLGHLLSLVDEFRARGAAVEFTNLALQASPDGRLLFAVRGAIAEFETHKIRQRMTAGKLARAREGRPVGGGHHIYGYAYDRAAKRFVPDPSEALVVRRIFRLAEEMGTHGIAAALNAAGVPTRHGGPWSQTSVYGILRNRTYLGRMPQMGGAGHVAVPPLVDAEAFERARLALARRRNRPAGPAHHDYLLTGHLRCGVCGRRMVGGYGRRRPGGYVTRYACAGKRARPRCPSPYYRAAVVDEAVWDRLRSWLGDAAERRRLAQRLAPSTATTRRHARAAWDVDRQRRRLWRAYRNGLLGDEDLRRQLAEIAAVERWAAGGRQAAPIAPEAGGDGAWLAEVLDRAAAAADPADRRLVVEALGLEVVLGPQTCIRITLAPGGEGDGLRGT